MLIWIPLALINKPLNQLVLTSSRGEDLKILFSACTCTSACTCPNLELNCSQISILSCSFLKRDFDFWLRIILFSYKEMST